MFRSNTQVFTFSIHCQQNFPFNKQASDLDIGLHAGCQDKEYLAQLEEHLPWVVDSFRPDLVLYDAGVDPHVKDELGKLDLTDQVPSAIVGAVYIYSRHKYFEGYSRSVEERIPGFFLGAKCLLALSAMASAGCITVLLRTYGNIDLAALFKDCLKDTVGLRFTC
nr:hypothetical protein BaRGS_027654 [Batillaria attramentaria]